MKTDLAPRYVYFLILLILGFGLIFIAIIQDYAIDFAISQDNFIPIVFTWILAGINMLAIGFVLNRCRYITINPADKNQFIFGNLLTSTRGQPEKLTIEKRIWANLFRINFEGKQYYILSFDKAVNEYKKKK